MSEPIRYVEVLRRFYESQQRRILLDAPALAETAGEGGALIDLPYEWGEAFGTTGDRMAGAMTGPGR